MFFSVALKKILRIVGLIAAIVAVTALLAAPTTREIFLGYSLRRLPIYSVETDEKKVCLTFDAAWGADKTEGIIEILKKNQAKATFFLVGFWIDKYPEKVKALDDSGIIELGNHSENHPDMAKLKPDEMLKELISVNEKLKIITNKNVNYFRPPFGSYNDTLIETAGKAGLRVIQWDVDSLDWKDTASSGVASRVLSKVRNGSIVLFHNNSDCILDALGIIVATLKNRGYSFITVGEMVYSDGYVIDHTGRMRKTA